MVWQWKFLLKGEAATINKVFENSIERITGLNFIDVEIIVQGENNEELIVQSKVLLEVLSSERGEIPYEMEKNLYHDRLKRNKIYRESLRIADDPYLGALRLRYSYAMTCHKAQGGEWENIILHPYYKKDDYQWQYTAITRGKTQVLTY
ncbi:MAG: ATP-binding domain-containing protein [Bacteroidetes bacterium]|nr:ATP-binding domain-containing protein [Bacteroidota bacterium]